MRCAQGTSFVSPLRRVVDVRLFVLLLSKREQQNKQTSHQPQRIQQSEIASASGKTNCFISNCTRNE